MCRYISWNIQQIAKLREYSNTYKSGVILIRADNSFLLVKNYDQKWSFPKGGRERDEDPTTTAARELYEETGIYLPESRLKIFYRYYKHIYFVYNAQELEYNENSIKNRSEINGIGWFCFQHLASLNITKPTEKILRLIYTDLESSQVVVPLLA